MQNPDTLALTQELIARASVTPLDGGCQQLMRDRLAAAGFKVERMDFGQRGEFLGHARQRQPGVVASPAIPMSCPPAPLEEWKTEPFKPTLA